ncbi:MAG: ABC transporter substrate-binding protein, partial [Bacteroidales bacterium]|nr:ABC transporter substrate-binding protein [Bacteroidales bacterium]
KQSSTQENQEGYVCFTDYYGRSKKINTNPQKVISLSPGITELIFDIKMGKRIVGRTNYCNYPPEAKNIKSMGGISDANIELIVAQQPDLVLTASMVSKQMIERLESLGLNVVCLPERNKVSDVYETISLLGKIFEQEDLCDSLIDNMKQKLADIEKNIDNSKKPSVYYVAGFGETGDYTAGGNTFINDIIRLAGGENLAKDLNGWAISKEAIFARQPDFIIVRQEDLNTFKSTAPYNKLKAVIENRVLGIESSLTDCQTLRSVEAIKQINDFISKNQ